MTNHHKPSYGSTDPHNSSHGGKGTPAPVDVKTDRAEKARIGGSTAMVVPVGAVTVEAAGSVLIARPSFGRALRRRMARATVSFVALEDGGSNLKTSTLSVLPL